MTRQPTKIRGILPAMITPLTDDGSAINVESLLGLTEYLIDAGVGGLIPGGSTGEFSALTLEERKLLHATVIDAAAGRVPVIAQTGALSTKEAIELSTHAAAAGAASLMVVPPYYEGLSFAEVKGYYTDVAAAVDIPIMLYHIPELTGVHLTFDQLADLTEIPGVELIKDSSGDATAMLRAHQLLGDKLQVCNGWDSFVFLSLASGLSTVVWGAACIFPNEAVALYNAVAVEGDLVKGRKIWNQLYPLVEFLESESYNARVKFACNALGLGCGPSRAPLAPVDPDSQLRLRELLSELGLVTAAK